jgi:hypothetical protein
MGLTKAEIEVAVAKDDWQELRQSLKGTTTKQKLKALHDWLDNQYSQSSRQLKDVQVLNYLNALSRGGQIMPVEQVRGQHLYDLFSRKRIQING